MITCVLVLAILHLLSDFYAIYFINLKKQEVFVNAKAYYEVCMGMIYLNVIINIPVFCFVGWLFSYHIWLFMVGKSTYQHILDKR